MSEPKRIITLLTDFGLRDHYVAAMKGVILSLNSDVTLVDVSHSVPPHDIRSGAFTISQTYACFPPNTIHLLVVDPGVGTARRGLAVSAAGQYFIAPDNGLLTYVLRAHPDYTAYEIKADHYFRKPVSSTFHGRDIFAPIAAWLSRDVAIDKFGPPLANPIVLDSPESTRVRDNLIQATILSVDQFGNAITNIKPSDLPRACKILAAQREITTFRRTFGEGKPGELFVIPGSSGYLEIVIRDGSAAAELGLSPGAPIGVVLQ